MTAFDRLGNVQRTFQSEAQEWDRLARRYHTRYDEMLTDLTQRLRLPKGARILDLGCGTGILAEMLLERCEGSAVTALDFSANMIEATRKRLIRFGGRVSFINDAFESMPAGPYDAIVSTLALHHIGSASEKRTQYRQIIAALVPGGCFWQGEYVTSSSPEDSAYNEVQWAEWLRLQGWSEDEIDGLRHRVAANDRPASLRDNLAWLEESGFVRVDCTWRYLKFAVFGGWKPGGAP